MKMFAFVLFVAAVSTINGLPSAYSHIRHQRPGVPRSEPKVGSDDGNLMLANPHLATEQPEPESVFGKTIKINKAKQMADDAVSELVHRGGKKYEYYSHEDMVDSNESDEVYAENNGKKNDKDIETGVMENLAEMAKDYPEIIDDSKQVAGETISKSDNSDKIYHKNGLTKEIVEEKDTEENEDLVRANTFSHGWHKGGYGYGGYGYGYPYYNYGYGLLGHGCGPWGCNTW